jgi:hypothetical protein
MPRLIEQAGSDLPSRLTLRLADVLVVRASGGHVRSGDAVELLGAYVPATLTNDAEIISPASAPNTVLFVARREGTSRIAIVLGDPWHTTRTRDVDVTVVG